MTLKRRPALPTDKEMVYRINCAAYRDLVIAQFGAWDETWQRDYFEKKWNPDRYSIICSGDDAIGVLATENYPDHIFLAEIQIDPSYQNRGIGSQIMNELCAEAQHRNIPIRLRVLRLNRARRLYERLGFVQISENATHFYMEWRQKNGTIG
jgi:ribosomal protein S18 acetylase RimI-like enzyme